MTATKNTPLWLFPAAYLVHVTEEFIGGAGLSLKAHSMEGVNLTPVEFILFTGGGALLIHYGLKFARQRGFPQLMLIMLSTIFLVNGLLHIRATLRAGAYNPGVVTSPLILIPLGVWTLYRLRDQMSLARYGCGIALGAGVYFAITTLAHHGRSLFG
jgi:Protein of unknown function with HXXEE motif